jgi:hypothetical protein
VKKLLYGSIFIFALFLAAHPAMAGFGISPPYVKTKNPIFPGSHYEQIITLLRSSAEEALEAKVAVEAPEIASWVRIEQGDSFELPAGALQVPMKVVVDVPKDAEIGNYAGYINVHIVPKGALTGSGVAIALGARIDIDLEVTNEAFIDFMVRMVDIPAIEELKAPWRWPVFSWLLYRVNVVMKIENLGNIETSPTRVEMDVYDINERGIIATYVDKKIPPVPPFQIADVEASFLTKLEAGEYWARTRIYKGNEIVNKDKIIFAVHPPGQSPNPFKPGWAGYGLALGYLALLLVLAAAFIKGRSWRYLFKFALLLLWPLIFLGRLLFSFWQRLNRAFWRWLHKKSSRIVQGSDRGDRRP